MKNLALNVPVVKSGLRRDHSTDESQQNDEQRKDETKALGVMTALIHSPIFQFSMVFPPLPRGNVFIPQ